MTPAQVEAWALLVAEAALAGGQDEDSRVEMKGVLSTDHAGVAWQLGGHANAARGQAVLWIIGVDPREGGKLSTPPREEFSNWWPQVQKHFDDQLAPTLVHTVTVPVRDQRVVALYFETDRAPYVVKKQDQRMVPMRVATGTLAAGRQQLLRLLAPVAPLPTYERPVGRVSITEDEHKRRAVFGSVTVFVLPQDQGRLYIARHRCKLRVRFPEAGLTYDIPIQSLGEYDDDPNVDPNEDYGWELMPVEKPLKLEVYGNLRVETLPTLSRSERPEVDLTIGLTTTEVRSTVTAVCKTEEGWRGPPNRMWVTVIVE